MKALLKESLLRSKALTAYQSLCSLVLVQVVRLRYRWILRRLRHSVRNGRKIRVVFHVDDTSKWKAQSLYEAMYRSERFEPVMALSIVGHDVPIDKIAAKVESDKSFYAKKGNRCEIVCDLKTGELLSLEDLRPDIVFFQEPWALSGEHRVAVVSKYALCCYIPYSVEWEAFTKDSMEFLPYFHSLLYLNIQWNRDCERYFKSRVPWWRLAGDIVGIGHPIFDQLQARKVDVDSGYVIFAPHFAFPWPGFRRSATLSSFLWSGVPMLQYAQRHPEVKWVFKPHPILRIELERRGVWTKGQIDDYYQQWEEIATTCYDGDYPQLFRSSRAMITDCASFLLEYSACGKPLVRLIPKELDFFPQESVKPLFETFYNVHDADELPLVLDRIVLSGEDSAKDARIKELQRLDVCGADAAGRILEHFMKMIGK